MPGIFSRIIAGEIPCYKIAENEQFFSFLDINPIVYGHVLIVPKLEIDHFFDVPDDYLANWLLFAKPIAKSIEANFDCDRCGLSVIGLEVSHAHMHLMPIKEAGDSNFSKSKLKLSKEEFIAMQQKIIKGL